MARMLRAIVVLWFFLFAFGFLLAGFREGAFFLPGHGLDVFRAPKAECRPVLVNGHLTNDFETQFTKASPAGVAVEVAGVFFGRSFRIGKPNRTSPGMFSASAALRRSTSSCWVTKAKAKDVKGASFRLVCNCVCVAMSASTGRKLSGAWRTRMWGGDLNWSFLKISCI